MHDLSIAVGLALPNIHTSFLAKQGTEMVLFVHYISISWHVGLIKAFPHNFFPGLNSKGRKAVALDVVFAIYSM